MDFLRNSQMKKVSLTLGLCLAYLLLIMATACIDIEDSTTLDGCPNPAEADAIGIKQVFYSPYKNQRYSTASDTVMLSEFGFNFELEIQEKENPNSGSLPGQAFALSCIKTYNIKNVFSITVLLLEPFANLPTGTDISYLLITPEKKPLSQVRDFDNVSVYFGSTLAITPPNYSQLKTRTFLFLKNGTQKVFDSTSPFLKTN